MIAEKKMQQQMQEQQMETLNTSTDENEIMETLLQQRAQMGAVPEEPEGE